MRARPHFHPSPKPVSSLSCLARATYPSDSLPSLTPAYALHQSCFSTPPSSHTPTLPFQHLRADPHCVVCGSYVGYLFFQLKTHHALFMEEEADEEPALSVMGAVGLLGIVTVLVAFASECAPPPIL